MGEVRDSVFVKAADESTLRLGAAGRETLIGTFGAIAAGWISWSMCLGSGGPTISYGVPDDARETPDFASDIHEQAEVTE